jgi:hypothetical protein
MTPLGQTSGVRGLLVSVTLYVGVSLLTGASECKAAEFMDYLRGALREKGAVQPRGRREGDLRGWPRQEGSPGGERLQGVGLGRTYRAGVLLWAPAIFVPRRPPGYQGCSSRS